jgi:hypothetical protein
VRGTIGSGGMTLKLNTVNGSVMIRRGDGRTVVAPPRPLRPAGPRRTPAAEPPQR